MNEQYNSLGKSLYYFYASRILSLSFIFILILALINSFFQLNYQFSDQPSVLKFDKMSSIFQTSAGILESMVSVTQSTILLNKTANTTKYCSSNQSVSECKQFLFKNLENEQIYSNYQIFNSFTCLSPDCSEVSTLEDYYWTFKIRLDFISYFIIQYSANGHQKSLVAPACSNYSQRLSAMNSSMNEGSRWRLYNDNGVIGLWLKSENILNISAVLVLDVDNLVNEYSIEISDYIFSEMMGENVMSYSLQDSFIFGYIAHDDVFIVRLWIFNVIIGCVCLVVLIPHQYLMKKYIIDWQDNIFKQINSLDSLYKYQINSIFDGEKPKTSIILSQTSLTYFYQELSQIIHKDSDCLIVASLPVEKQQTFKFIKLIDEVMDKFEELLKPVEQQRSREFTNLKPLIRTSINEISDNVGKKLRQIYLKCRQLLLTPQFFYFGYLSLLTPISAYDALLIQQKLALPDAMVNLFRYMNHTVNSVQIKFAFKFAFAYKTIIQQQIIMKLQDNLLQKYLISIKDFDIGNINYAYRLGLRERLDNLQKILENKKHIFSVYLK